MALRPGDIVSRRKGPFRHIGIVVGDDEILHNTPLRGEHLSSTRAFAKGKGVCVEYQDTQGRSRVVKSAKAHLESGTRSYNPLTNNCEHTVNRITTGRAHSPQLQLCLTAIGTGVLALVASRNPSLARAARMGRRWLAER